MATLTERLAFILTLDAGQAVKGFQTVGKEADKATKTTEERLDKLGGTFTKAGAGMLAFAGVAGVGLFKLAQSASDVNEALSATQVTFGKSARSIQSFADVAATSFGISKKNALDASNTFGVFGKSAGLAGGDLANFSTRMVGLAGDLASFRNTSPEQAIQAIGAALRGESEPIRQYGVLLDDATLKHRAMTLGIYDGSGALTQQQRVLAAQAEILAQTSDAQGDYARTSGSLANQQRTLAAELDNLKATIGAGLLPIFQKLVGWVSDAAAAFGALPTPVQHAIGGFAGFATAGLALGGALAIVAGRVIKMHETIGKVIDAFRGMTAAGQTATLGLGAVGLVIAAATIAYSNYAKGKAEAKAVTDTFVQALHDEAAGQRDAIKAAIAKQLADEKTAAAIKATGLSIRDVGNFIRGDYVPAIATFVTLSSEFHGQQGKLNDALAQYGVHVEGNVAKNILLGNTLSSLRDEFGAAVQQVGNQTAAEQALGVESGKAATAQGALTSASGDAAKAADVQAAATAEVEHQQEGYKAALDDVVKRQEDAASAAGNFSSALGDVFGSATNVQGAMDQTAQDFADLKDRIDGARKGSDGFSFSLNNTTESGRKNREQIRSSVEGVQSYIEKLAESGATSDQVDGQYAMLRQQLVNQLHQFHLTDQQAQDYINTLGLTPDRVTTAIEQTNMATAKSQVLDYLNNHLNRIPPSKLTEILSAVNRGGFDEAMRLINAIPASKTTVITSINRVIDEHYGVALGPLQFATPHARGGTVGPAERFQLLGEQGAEIAELPTGTKVHTASETKGMLASGGDTYNVTFSPTIVGASNPEATVAALESWVRRNGPQGLTRRLKLA